MENRGKTITAVFVNERTVATAPLWQRDYGQVLIVKGLPLPLAFETRFSMNGGESKPQIGSTEDGIGSVTIPDEFLDDSGVLTAYIFLHEGEDDGETEYVITTRIRPQPEVDNEPVTPVQQDVITQAIAALDNAVEITTNNAEKSDKSAEDSEAWAVGERKGVPVEDDDETYQNNSKWYSDLSAQHAEHAGYIYVEVDPDTMRLIVKSADSLYNDMRLNVNESTGHLEVNVSV